MKPLAQVIVSPALAVKTLPGRPDFGEKPCKAPVFRPMSGRMSTDFSVLGKP